MDSTYLGCIGYNDSPEELGEPGGFWWFEDEDELWETFNLSQQLDAAFDQLGSPTYSAVLLIVDQRGSLVAHLLVISTEPVYGRQNELLVATIEWLNGEGYALSADRLSIGIRPAHPPEKHPLLQVKMPVPK